MRYLTNLLKLAIFIWSMIFSTLGFGQTLTHDGASTFTLNLGIHPIPPPPVDPPGILEVGPRFGTFTPFYDALMITGDGNFMHIEDITQGAIDWNIKSFDYQYLDYTNNYPGLMLLLDRKTGDEPPGPDGIGFRDQFVLPGLMITGGSINISSLEPVPTDKVEINLTHAHERLIHLGNPNKRIVMDFSHTWNNSGVKDYYLKSNRSSTFPIAYKPGGAGELLLFFYNSVDFAYTESPPIPPYNVVSSYSGNALPFGTYFPDYYNGAVNIADKSNNVRDERISGAGGAYPTISLSIFDNVLTHVIDANEVTAFTDGGGDEFRMFPLVVSKDLGKEVEYPFLTVLYGPPAGITVPPNISGFPLSQLNGLNNQLDVFDLSQNIPQHIQDDDDIYHSFVDYWMLRAIQGEPDDPNGLKITSICEFCPCSGDDDYTVTFNLKFCNEDPITNATGASVILLDKEEGIFSCFKLIDIIPESDECFIREDDCVLPCDHDFSEVVLAGEFLEKGGPTHELCLNFRDGVTLGENDCANIIFSAKVKREDIEILTERSVWRYCVSLLGGHGPDRQEVCNDNDVLNKVTSYWFQDDQYLVQKFKKNEIWEKRGRCYTEGNCCFIVPICGLWCKWFLFLSALGLICVFWYYRKRFYKPQD